MFVKSVTNEIEKIEGNWRSIACNHSAYHEQAHGAGVPWCK
ncbi:hypothetical protein HanXRQr2_Chr12g0555451 [Helianthus annuus]|uniref:Uncharacterized protein n=1 Tax=Helianthus annuus TaxID=4232 RepID=A0A9K3MX83_HELAN|nr:hypothetical protein HanXRQr2_Chr12g0555451 [Helianthus annuus]